MARKYSKSASKDVEGAMKKRKKGTLRSGKGGKGGKVESRKQAMTDELEHRYLEHYHQFLDATRAACRANGIHYLPASTSVDPLELLIESARRGLMLHARTGA